MKLITLDALLYFKDKLDTVYSKFSGSYNDLSDKPTLSTVATSGSYDDLSNKPDIAAAYTLPTASATEKGGVKIGSNLSMVGDVLSSTNTTYANATTATAGLMSTTDKSKLDSVAAGAEVNVNADWDATSGDALIANKPTKVSDFTNDSGFQTSTQVSASISAATASLATTSALTNAVTGLASESYVDGKVSSTYKASGSVAFASLPALTSADAVVGNVYNITNSFVTTADFTEGAGVSYGAGTNVAIVEISGSKKYDAMAGLVDLSGYVQNSDLIEVTNAEIDALFT